MESLFQIAGYFSQTFGLVGQAMVKFANLEMSLLVFALLGDSQAAAEHASTHLYLHTCGALSVCPKSIRSSYNG